MTVPSVAGARRDRSLPRPVRDLFVVIGCSDFTGVSQLGWMTALAMLLNVVATFVLLPAMLFAWGAKAIPAQPAG